MKPGPSPRRATAKLERRPIGAAVIELAAQPHRQPGAATPAARRPPGRLALEQALLVNAVTASDSGAALDTMLAHAINTANTTIYDKAIDSAYLSTGVGGSRLHHLVDGQHDLLGAFSAAQAASPNGSLGGELFGTAHHLTKDLFSKMGLPVFSLEPDTYHHSADWIQQHLGISKLWQADLLQINGMELLGGGLSAAAVVMGAKQKDARTLAEIAGSAGLAGMVAANPIAMLAATTALVLAWQKKHPDASVKALAAHAGTGMAATGATMATGTILGGFAATGALPLTVSLALSLAAGILVRWLIRRTGAAQAQGAVVQDTSAQLWQRHVQFAALEIRDHLDAAALELLRKAFQPATAMHPVRLLSR